MRWAVILSSCIGLVTFPAPSAEAEWISSQQAATQVNQGNYGVHECTPSNGQGVSTCTFQDATGTRPGTDTAVFDLNPPGGGTPGPDANEPQDAVHKAWTAGQQNLGVDVSCVGAGTADDHDVAEQEPDSAGTPDCSNPLGDHSEVFRAVVTNAANVGRRNIRVDFSFGQRTNGNAAGDNDSTNDATLSAAGGEVGTDPPGLQTSCVTNAEGTCSVKLTNQTPQAGDTIEVIGVISGQTAGGPARDGVTAQWQSGRVNQVGAITLTPRAAINQVATAHTVTASVRNQFGMPVQGANVDFDITDGPNVGLAQAGMTDAVTDVDGRATFTYASNAFGTDTIVACTETGGSENDSCNPGEPMAEASSTWANTHDRAIGVKFTHKAGGLVISGVLSVTESGFAPCFARQTLEVQRRIDKKWVTKASPRTDDNGRYRVEVPDRPGAYRVIAPQTVQADPATSNEDVCLSTKRRRTHRH